MTLYWAQNKNEIQPTQLLFDLSKEGNKKSGLFLFGNRIFTFVPYQYQNQNQYKISDFELCDLPKIMLLGIEDGTDFGTLNEFDEDFASHDLGKGFAKNNFALGSFPYLDDDAGDVLILRNSLRGKSIDSEITTMFLKRYQKDYTKGLYKDHLTSPYCDGILAKFYGSSKNPVVEMMGAPIKLKEKK